jgi:hypothetical protein
MPNHLPDVASILLRRGLLTAEQVEEAHTFQRQHGGRLEDALIRLGYATPQAVAEALAEAHGVPFIDLTAVTIPQNVIELLPESVARENTVLPLALAGSALLVITSDPGDMDVRQKLAFTLNRAIRPVVAPREQIIEAINRYYGQTETESVDSMLAEFTDTAIDFPETEALADEAATDFEVPPAAGTPAYMCPLGNVTTREGPAKRKRRSGGAPVERQATVRYYQQMNPERMFPLLVVLSKKAVQEVIKRGVAQAASKRFRVEPDAPVEVEPILPGCSCYPQKEQVAVDAEAVSVTFWVVPHVLGKVMRARVVIRQEGRVLAEVPLEVRVARQTLTVLLGALSVALPFTLMVLKHFRLDFESQQADGFGLYAQAANWALHSLSPEVLTGAILLLAVGVYFWLRPRRRDVFWDVTTDKPSESLAGDGMLLLGRDDEAAGGKDASEPDAAGELQATLFARAEEHYGRHEYAAALRFYDSGLALGRARPAVYHHASLSAHHAGNAARALAILQQAEAELPDAEIRGPLWYNLGCFAARLGRLDDALHYLNRAADRGCTDPDKYQNDPDLAPLRWRRDFNKLLGSLRSQATT